MSLSSAANSDVLPAWVERGVTEKLLGCLGVSSVQFRQLVYLLCFADWLLERDVMLTSYFGPSNSSEDLGYREIHWYTFIPGGQQPSSHGPLSR